MSSALTSGTIFAGRYRVERRIARGAMGAVYEVVHLETERRRALKVMHAHILQGEESEALRERFKREAKVAAYVDSEFIVDVFDAGVDEAGRPFLVMELLRGEELGKRVKRLGRLPLAEVITYLYQTALALDKTHRAAIVHRDIKPGNLFFTEREDGKAWIKVLDFGVAKILAEGAAGATQAIGTPLYMAPEQFNPRAKLTGAADIYALGMVAYTLLVGEPYRTPEAREGGVFALARFAESGLGEPASVRALALGVRLPPGFDAWFSRCTATEASERFATATEAVRALAEATGSQGLLPASGPPSARAASAFAQVGEEPTKEELPVSSRSGAPSSRGALPGVGGTVPGASQSAGRSLAGRKAVGRGKSAAGVLALLGLGVILGLGVSALRSGGDAPVRAEGAADQATASAAPGARPEPSPGLVGALTASAVPVASASSGPSVAPAMRATSSEEGAGSAKVRGASRGDTSASGSAKAPSASAATAQGTASKAQGTAAKLPAPPQKPASAALPPSKRYTRD